MQNPYPGLTAEFNRNRMRAILSSEQAVVAHRLAVMSKDGDWILREQGDDLSHVLVVTARQLGDVWAAAERSGNPVIGITPLATLKLTNRERDYAVIGELARLMSEPEDQLRFSRSARDLIELARRHPEIVSRLDSERPVLGEVAKGREALEEALDRERRQLMHANEERLQRYLTAGSGWASIWQDVQREIADLPLLAAHEVVVDRAQGVLPFHVGDGDA